MIFVVLFHFRCADRRNGSLSEAFKRPPPPADAVRILTTNGKRQMEKSTTHDSRDPVLEAKEVAKEPNFRFPVRARKSLAYDEILTKYLQYNHSVIIL